MSKRFAIIGSGWRAEFYIRIALHPGNDFILTGLLCRSAEKQQKLYQKYGISPTLSEAEIVAGEPDFVVVAVSKQSIAQVSAHWRELGFPVLCETPVAMNWADLQAAEMRASMPLFVAEQYRYYDTYRKLLDVVHSGKLGEIVSASVSLAHDYHGASLLRAVLIEPYDASYRLMARKYELPVTKTADRYHSYADGEIYRRFRTAAMVEFEDGKVGFYDFDGEQYRSPIRHNRIHITGTRGELMNEQLWTLDEQNRPVQERWIDDLQAVRAPAEEGTLSQDEGAILHLMEQLWPAARAAKGHGNWTEDLSRFCRDNPQSAVADAAFMLLMQENDGKWVSYRHKQD